MLSSEGSYVETLLELLLAAIKDPTGDSWILLDSYLGKEGPTEESILVLYTLKYCSYVEVNLELPEVPIHEYFSVIQSNDCDRYSFCKVTQANIFEHWKKIDNDKVCRAIFSYLIGMCSRSPYNKSRCVYLVTKIIRAIKCIALREGDPLHQRIGLAY